MESKSKAYGLDKRENMAKCIDGTQRLHHFTPVDGSTSHMLVKETSYDNYWPKKQSVKIGFKDCL